MIKVLSKVEVVKTRNLIRGVMSLNEKATREALISLGWTPPWGYNMEEAPKDGTMLLLKTDTGHIYRGSWRVDEGCSGDTEPQWLDDSYDDWSISYASVPLTPIAW